VVLLPVMTERLSLVTGASGFIGSALVKKLIARGQRVRAFVRPSSSLKAFEGLPRDRLELAYGDILVEHTVFRALYGCQGLYHVAANFAWGGNDPKAVLEPAILGTRAVLEAARRHKLQKIVVTSSAGALGVSADGKLMDESHAFNLTDPEVYLEAKLKAEEVALEAARAGQPVVVVLPASVVGPGDHKPTPTGKGVLFYLRTPPGMRVAVPEGGLNVVDVDDVAEGHVLAMEHGRVGERYILGGDNLSFEELVNTLSDVTGLASAKPGLSQSTLLLVARVLGAYAWLSGQEPLVTAKLIRAYTSGKCWVDSGKAERELGFRARGARESLSRSVQWFLEHGYVPDRLANRVRLEFRSA
jgi:dihydroflavonol-4-reductase